MKALLLVLAICLFSTHINAQQNFSIQYLKGNRSDWGLGYNYFVGPDANSMHTTIMGFGSGFLFDIFTGRYAWDLVTVGTERINLSLGLGYAISKYRFADNLVFEKIGNNVIVFEDVDPTHEYNTGFFSYSKSKLVYGSIYTPLDLNFETEKFHFHGGIFLDLFISGKLKRKFKKNDEKEIEKVPNSEFNNFPLNKEKVGFQFALTHKPSNFGIAYTRMLTSFFKPGKGPEVYESRISLSYKFKTGKNFSDRKKTKDKES